jgi:hypothetical protein
MIRVRESAPDRVSVSGLPEPISDMLCDLPKVLARRDDAARRLYPDPHRHNPRAAAEWHQLMDGDLRHLFASAADLVTGDLATLDRQRGEVTFPAAHLSAWMSALNQARLILGEIHEVTESDMERDDLDPFLPRDLALVTIGTYGFLLELLVRFSERGVADAEE